MLYVVGIGPGNRENMTFQALKAIKNSSSVVGYKTYINLVEGLLEDKKVFSNGMRKEIDRCKKAVEIAESGEDVSVVSSGDAGVFGMAGLVLEIISKSQKDVEVEIIPGIPSANGAAASLGAPLMHDYVSISLSDLLTPWKLIEKRIKLAAEGDFVICIYNPKSKGRPENLNKAVDIIMEYKLGSTPVGIVKNAKRKGEKVKISNLGRLKEEEVDMTTMVVIGNSNTYTYKDYLITPRGYQL
ncbi:MAG: precorrin-3B C(17)-methyltransferase [Eubacteriales bacterium]